MSLIVTFDKAPGVSQREYDLNGWFEVKNNPISKVGIFPYLGRSIGAPEPDRIYQVLRPESALSDPEAIKSFRLLPFIDDHEMLGEGHMGAEEKGVGGVIGEDVYFLDGTLYANLRVFSERLADRIANGKKELSAGYRCRYELTPGVWHGQQYDAIQLDLRGNHIALVDQGRMGPDVSVLDHLKITLDAKDLTAMSKKLKQIKALDALDETIKGLRAAIAADADVDPDEEKAEDADEDKEAADEDEEKAEDADEDKEDTKATDAMDKRISALAKTVGGLVKSVSKLSKRPSMDSADVFKEASKRDALARSLAPHIGVFDHSEMTHSQVAKYGVKKLGIACDSGQEVAALNGFLKAAVAAKPAIATDSAPKKAPDFLADYVA